MKDAKRKSTDLVKLELTMREFDTVLAALRLWQSELEA